MSQMTQDQVNTKTLVTENLVMGSNTVSGILTETDPIVDNDPNAIVSGGYLDVSLAYLRNLAKIIDPTGSGIPEQTLISNSLVVPFFQRADDFEFKQWVVDTHFNAQAIGNQPNNYIRIPNTIVRKQGNYLLYLNITKLPIASKLDIYIGETWIKTISTLGEHYVELIIDEPMSVSIVAVDLASGTNIILSSVEIYNIAERFYVYLIQKIKSLATITSDAFVTVELFNRTMDAFVNQFQEATAQYLDKLNEHTIDDNPHNITPEGIDAATKDHSHAGMVTMDNVEQIISTFSDDRYATTNHTHDEYISQNDLRGAVSQVIVEELSTLVSVDSQVIVSGETGTLPSKLMAADVDTPVQILLPTTINHNGVTSYDVQNGLITTNKKELVDEAPKVFSLSDTFANIPVSDDPVNFRIKYHHDRKISGYRVYSKQGIPTKWTVYSDDRTFIHEVTDATFVEASGMHQTEILLESDTTINALSFMILETIMEDPNNWQLKIEILYTDFANYEFGITNKEFKFTISDKGTNRLVTSNSTNIAPLKCTPQTIVENSPLYVFGNKNADDNIPTYSSSYYRPEYNNARIGYLALEDKYNELEKHIVSGSEQYQHPVYGNLTLKEGITFPSSKLTDIYSSSDMGWMSDGNASRITIEQSIINPNVVLCGYSLRWQEDDLSKIPGKWTLTIEGHTETGVKQAIVLDSVKEYYPFYSAEEGDVVYSKRFTPTITVSKIILTMEKDVAHVIALNKLHFYLSERYHSTSKNISYLGLTPVSQMCLGSVIYRGDKIGWEANNLYVGKSVTVPVNNMAITESDVDYSFVNPFFTIDVYTNVRNFILDSDTTIPSAKVTTVTDTEGTLHSENSARYAVTISRVW